MLFTKISPTLAKLTLRDELIPIVTKALTYSDSQSKYEYEKYKKNVWAARSDDNYQAKLEYLKQQAKKCLLLEKDGEYFVYTGLFNHLQDYLKLYNESVDFIDETNYPDFKLIPFDLNYKPLNPRYYQKIAVEKLLEAKHASIEFPTGAGKTLVALNLCKQTGLKTLIVTPTISIANQFYKLFVKAFGKKYVGMFGDGKKQSDKLFTISIAASLVRVTDEQHIKNIKQNQVLIWDEAHLTAADTLSKVCLDLCKNIQYRFFVSATQLRTDGKDLLLEAVIGPIVYRKSYAELVKEGFLAELKVKMIMCNSLSKYNNPNNPKKSAQEHLLYNKIVLQKASEIINQALSKNEPTVVLMDELEQIQLLKNYLKYSFEEATSETDVNEVVDKFNNGLSNLILGTSAIGMGTDILPVKNIVLLQAGSSEIKLRQALGRGTRLFEGKTYCNVYDFNVNAASGPYHFKNKYQIYRSMGITQEVVKND